jgi:hypothetical protein
VAEPVAGEQLQDPRLAVIVGRYTIPFAALLVASGILFSRSPGVRMVCAAFLVFAVVFNVAVVEALKNNRSLVWLRSARVRVNFANNLIMVYLMWNSWSPAWLLLALTPLAVAVYDTRAKTIAAAASAAAALFLFNAAQGRGLFVEWDIQLVHAAFIFAISLMINDLARMLRARADAV